MVWSSGILRGPDVSKGSQSPAFLVEHPCKELQGTWAVVQSCQVCLRQGNRQELFRSFNLGWEGEEKRSWKEDGRYTGRTTGQPGRGFTSSACPGHWREATGGTSESILKLTGLCGCGAMMSYWHLPSQLTRQRKKSTENLTVKK